MLRVMREAEAVAARRLQAVGDQPRPSAAGGRPRKKAGLKPGGDRPAMSSILVVQHVHAHRDGTEDVKFIGVHSSKHVAGLGIRRLCRKPGFRSTARGFHVDRYELDHDHWTEGYITDRPRRR